tara:strand:- start:5514 stop:5615 length:102 start_codon:yes stop_codon:yes gene_type:complete
MFQLKTIAFMAAQGEFPMSRFALIGTLKQKDML